mmetsp:Transcript_12445/g.26815  ORF Transcript_12445/g.26815 Transcript_12445/m.26815 type:complete len:1210 (-) Transcript_12445:141-3770(-)
MVANTNRHTTTRTSSSKRRLAPLLPTVLLAFLRLTSALESQSEYFCGTSWSDAAHSCHKHCPTGDDVECIGELGEGFGCYYFTGCSISEDEDEDSDADGDAGDDPTAVTVDDAASYTVDNYCGTNWIHAMLTCDEESKCPNGWECANPDERCFAATNCHEDLQALVSSLVSTLSGPDTVMDDEDSSMFGEEVFAVIAQVAEELGIALGGVNVGEQSLVTRRELRRRMNERRENPHEVLGGEYYLNYNVTQRRLPSGSSAVDVSMVVTGDYRPPPFIDLDVVAEDSINRNGPSMVKKLRERGQRAGRDFFTRVRGIEAVATRDMTRRPTQSPQNSPTWSPQGPPTAYPSAMPSFPPSDVPSSSPSRDHDQVIMTGSRQDMQLGDRTTSSFGYIWNMRTKPDSGVLMITGMDFYTQTTNDVDFELWTRLGTFKGFKGSYEGWVLIAKGTTRGRGIGRYTTIPEEYYTPVSIPGGGVANGGVRSFYLTLGTRELVYKLGSYEEGEEADSDLFIHHDSQELEIWEGEGVLWYPFPDPSQVQMYRKPRQYLGAIYYNRLPCTPFSLYGVVQQDLPCPFVPTGSPTVPPPTQSPVTQPPSVSPVFNPTNKPSRSPTVSPVEGQTPAPVEPTGFPTATPTISVAPTMYPTTAEPTMSPVVPMRVNLVTTLRNVPERSMTVREEEKYIAILTAFLKRHTGSSMVLDGIDLWHQELISVAAKEGTVTVEAENKNVIARGATREISQSGRKRKERLPEIVEVPAVDITVVLRIQIANLPTNLLGNMAAVALREHEEEFLALLKEQQAFYTFFRGADGVVARVIDEVTYAPSASPTTEQYFLDKQAEMEAAAALAAALLLEPEVSNNRDSFGILVGLGVGFLWVFLTGISIAYLLSARGEMEEQRDMEELLKADKTSPLDDKGDDDDNSKDDTDDDGAAKSDPEDGKLQASENDVEVSLADTSSLVNWDSSDNPRLKSNARVELSKSTNCATRNGNRQQVAGMRSMIVTSHDNGAMLDNEFKTQLANMANKRKEEVGPKSTNHAPRNANRHQGAGMRSMVVTSQENRAMLDDEFKTRLANMAKREEEAGPSAAAGRNRSVSRGRRVLSQSVNVVGNARLRSSSRNRGSHGNLQGLGSRENPRQTNEKGSRDDLQRLAKSTTEGAPLGGQMLLARSGSGKARRGRGGDRTKPSSHSDTSIKKASKSRSRSRSRAMGKSMIA